ncbi:MAG: glycosyltransferase [Candidatus Kerfeldbacteria bacterium]|jgi:dolichol-phosphate mannosyltransferase
MNKLLTIIIPAYNEAERIGNTLDKYLEFYQEKNIEFLIVLNGCTDDTLSIVNKFKEEHPDRIRIINIKEAIGKGGAVREGFNHSKADFIGYLDADGSTSPEEFKKIIDGIEGIDGTIASRWKKGSKIVGANLLREIVSISFISFVKLLFFMPFIDTQCGAKIFKKEVIKDVLASLEINNMSFDVELLFRIHQAGYKVKEIPTIWIDNSDSSAALGTPLNLLKTGFNMFITLIKIRFRKI